MVSYLECCMVLAKNGTNLMSYSFWCYCIVYTKIYIIIFFLMLFGIFKSIDRCILNSSKIMYFWKIQHSTALKIKSLHNLDCFHSIFSKNYHFWTILIWIRNNIFFFGKRCKTLFTKGIPFSNSTWNFLFRVRQ